MKISYIKVSNYRNLEDITISFNPDCNYIIGENNLGKSNLLSLLGTVCNGKAFDENDFLDANKAIEVDLHIRLLPCEQGFFEDHFSPDDDLLLKIRYTQTIENTSPTIINVDSEQGIGTKLIRKINFLKYETTSIPSKELRLDSQKGAGLFVGELIKRFIDGKDLSFLNNSQVDSLQEYINGFLSHIRSFHDYGIKATISPNPTEMLKSLFIFLTATGKLKLLVVASSIWRWLQLIFYAR